MPGLAGRIARLTNVLAMRELQAKVASEDGDPIKKKPAQFTGLPIPIAANMIVALALATMRSA